MKTPKNQPKPPQFKIGDRVAITRHRYGQCNRYETGRVTKIGFRTGGAACYEVTTNKSVVHKVRGNSDLVAI